MTLVSNNFHFSLKFILGPVNKNHPPQYIVNLKKPTIVVLGWTDRIRFVLK